MAVNNQTIIVKRIKKVAGGHHGGAWKVAYADFVTAMMAFFLLLWLLNATEAENLAGLADYFAPTVGVKDEMGIGFRGGKSALSEGIGADKNTNKGIVFGGIPTGPIVKVTTKIEERTDQEPQEKIQVVINEVATEKKGAENSDETQSNPATQNGAAIEQKPEETTSEELQKTQQAVQTVINDMVKERRLDEGSVEIKRTPEGLMIEIKDLSGNSMFENDTAVMKDKLKTALVELSKIIKNLPNTFALIGHTSSTPIQTKISGYTKWELSADRANATRTFFVNNGVGEEQFSRIEGRADNIPYDKRRPDANINNRINIIILNKNDTPEHKRTTPDSILIDTKSDQTKKFLDETENKKKQEEEEKKKEEEKKGPAIDNTDVKKLLNESANTSKEAQKLTPADKEGLINEVIDLKIDKNKQPAPKAEPNKQDNSSFQNILNDAEKAAAAQSKGTRESLINNNVPDLSVDRSKAPVVVEEAPKVQGNDKFQSILQEAEKAAKSEMPKGSKEDLLNKNVIDLNVDRAKVPAIKEAPISTGNSNSTFQNILNDAEKTVKPKTSPADIKREERLNNVIDFDEIDKKAAEPEPVKAVPTAINPVFQQILDEAARIEKEAEKATGKTP